MSRSIRLVWVVPFLMGLVALADDPPKKGEQDNADAFVAKPTPQHKLLAQEEGVWDATLTFATPGSNETQTAKGVETNTMLAGLWLLSDFKGEIGGQPFQGRGQTGYDPKKGKYVGTWVDSMSSQLMIMEGTYDETTRTLTTYSQGVDPASGRPTKERQVTQFKGEDTRVFVMSVKPDGANDYMKMMEITYKRRKK